MKLWGRHVRSVMLEDVKKAFLVVWLLISSFLLLILLVPFILSEKAVLQLSAICVSSNHGPAQCPLCGMTRAFVAISRGNFHEALQLNRGSIGLYLAFVVDGVLALLYSVRKIRSWLPLGPAGTRSRRGASGSVPAGDRRGLQERRH